MKAIIPAAGLGTRLYPASKAIPKEMLPLVDRPVIQWVAEEAAACGISEIILITRPGKESIENHFDPQFVVESSARKAPSVLPDVTISCVRQERPLGLGHAVLCARQLIADDPAFAVLLPDVLLANGAADMQAMHRRWQGGGRGQILLAPVPAEQVHRYGIADCGGALLPGSGAALRALVEKPPPQQAPSNLAVVGRYILPTPVMDALAAAGAAATGEIELTDALPVDALDGFATTGEVLDCGTVAGYTQAQAIASLAHPDYGPPLAALLRTRL